MTRTINWRPSPMVIVAILALVGAAAGSAMAGSGATTSVAKPKVKKIAKKVAHRVIDRRAPNLSVGNSQRLAGFEITQLSPATSIDRTDDFFLGEAGQTVLSTSVTTVASHLLASASVEVSGDGTLSCFIRIDGGDGLTYSTDISGVDTLTISQGGADVGPGEHPIELVCSASGGVEVHDAGMTVAAHL